MPKKVKVRITKKVHAFAYEGVRYFPGDELEVPLPVFNAGERRGIMEKVEPPEAKAKKTESKSEETTELPAAKASKGREVAVLEKVTEESVES